MKRSALCLLPLDGLPLIEPGQNLGDIIFQTLQGLQLKLEDGDILVITQKIVSKAEGRLTNLESVKPSAKAQEIARICKKDARLVELILSESNEIVRVKENTLIVEHKLGFICANAGIDHSNVRGNWGKDEDWYLLLPSNPDQSARMIQDYLYKKTGKRIGILIIDSHGRAWRKGTVGITIGLAGVPGIVDMRGKEDLFGFHLKITQIGAADELAAAASLLMGQADEMIPIVHVRGFPYPLVDSKLTDILREKDDDLFR